MKRNILAVWVVGLTLVLGFAVIASADNGALADFNTKYPGNSYGTVVVFATQAHRPRTLMEQI